jgi:hypothetical protein
VVQSCARIELGQEMKKKEISVWNFSSYLTKKLSQTQISNNNVGQRAESVGWSRNSKYFSVAVLEIVNKLLVTARLRCMRIRKARSNFGAE